MRGLWRFAVVAALACVLTGGLLAGSASAKSKTKTSKTSASGLPGGGWWPAKDVQMLHLRYGPISIIPGQNTINFAAIGQRPKVPGWIVSFKPNLRYVDGSVPRVDVIHLHHGVWVINGQPTFAAGEEKTEAASPKGFGYPYQPTDTWLLNYMIHNLTPQPTKVYMDYDIGFIPATSPAAKGIIPVRTQWLDVEGGHIYPVFDVNQNSGRNGKYTFPSDAKSPYGGGAPLNRWTVNTDATIVGMVGHLHPGGLWDDMYITRNGVTRHLFRSRAHYFEPAGPVSWDVAMMGTPANWRVAVKKGDVISVTTTYDSGRGSWYEAMGIMPFQITDKPAGGVDPFTTKTDVAGVLNHGHLAENDHHGAGSSDLPNPQQLPSGLQMQTVPITNFIYGQGDLTGAGKRNRPPTVVQGQSLTFVNDDNPRTIWHTITACKAPCNAGTGIAYPLANAGSTQFDSGELGTGPPGSVPLITTAAANRNTWSTPTDLKPGTYTYFCRIHPFMRGSFRVLSPQ